jgi:hypothetical protein
MRVFFIYQKETGDNCEKLIFVILLLVRTKQNNISWIESFDKNKFSKTKMSNVLIMGY